MSTPLIAAKYGISWLLDLANADLSKLTDKQKIRVRQDAYNFDPDVTGISGFSRVGPLHYAKKYHPERKAEYEGATPLEKWAAVLQWQAELKVAIAAISSGKGWNFKHTLRQTITRSSRTYTGSDHDMFFARVADIFQAAWLLTCDCANKECGTRFLPEGKQRYCSGECRNEANWAKFTENHPRRKRNYRKEYLARVNRMKGGI